MDGFERMLIAAILFMVALIGFMFIVRAAEAHTLDSDECVALAQDAGFLFDRKAEEMPWAVAQPLVERDIQRALAHGGSYVQDPEDVLRLLSLAEAIWKTNAAKSDVQMSVWYQCIMKYQAELI